MKNKVHHLAIVGYGGMGSHHAKLVQTVEDLKLTGILDIDPERVEAAKSNKLHAYASLEEVLTDASIEIVLIATPNHIHKDLAIQALKAGKHVICEKPVTLNSKELREILDEAAAHNRMFVVHQNRRWDEDFRVIKKLYEERTLGDVFHIESRVQGSRGIPGDWRKVKEFGGGMMLDWQVHLLDQMLLLVPEKVKKVYCQLSFNLGEEVDDGARVMLTFESGKTAQIEVATCNYNTLPRWYVTGTTGTAVITDWDMSGKITRLYSNVGKDAVPVVTAAGVTKTMAPRDNTTIVDEPVPRMELDVRDFYRNVMATIDGKAEIIVRNEQVMRVLQLIEAAFKSGETGQVVDFE